MFHYSREPREKQVRKQQFSDEFSWRKRVDFSSAEAFTVFSLTLMAITLLILIQFSWKTDFVCFYSSFVYYFHFTRRVDF